MNVKLINEPVNHLSATAQILYNRGITDIKTYLNSSEKDINSPIELDEVRLEQALKVLISCVSAEKEILLVVDADCDGFCSSSLLYNYLYDLFPAYTKNHIHFFLHSGKQHGLSDCYEVVSKFDMVILPDSSSNDYEYHKILASKGISILVLDHHEAEKISEDAIIINNQMCDYPNKELSGTGVTWQFCRYIDSKMNTDYADNYLDLVALSLVSDMMSLKSIETKQLIFTGFREENIINPFIYEISEKNNFSLNKSDYKPSTYNHLKISPMGAAFFIAPFVNAIVRSGTFEEKELVFKSMLKAFAFEIVPSTKRGHKPGDTERIVDQAMRTCTNVKNRQTKAQDAGMELLEGMIKKYNMLEKHKVLLFLLEPGQIDKNIAGLAANKIMNKYQRPVCVLTKVSEELEDGKKKISYQGSARGYGEEMMFKDICAEASSTIYAEGHQGAFGLGIFDFIDDGSAECHEVEGEGILQFLDFTDEVFKDLSSEASYFVDYEWKSNAIDGEKILEIANMNDYWGQNINRALVYITGIEVSQETFKVMKSNTLKFLLPVADIIKFGGTEEEIDLFSTPDTVTINAVCKCCQNEWNYQINPQLQMVDYEVVKTEQANTIDAWGF